MLARFFASALILFAISARADTNGFEVSSLTEAQLDLPRTAGLEFVGGTLTIGYEIKTVRLNARFKNVCAPGRLCAQQLPQPILVELPIVSIERGDCGETVITAEEGDERLIVTDFRSLECRLKVPHVTEVRHVSMTYDFAARSEVATESVFRGQALRLPYRR